MNFDWMWPLQYSFTIDFIWIDRLKTMRWCDWFSLKFILYDRIKMLLYSSILHSIGKFKRLFIRFFASVAQFQFFSTVFRCLVRHTILFNHLYPPPTLSLDSTLKFTYANVFVICCMKFSLSNWKANSEYFVGRHFCVCVGNLRSVHTWNHPMTKIWKCIKKLFFFSFIWTCLWAIAKCRSFNGKIYFYFLFFFLDANSLSYSSARSQTCK